MDTKKLAFRVELTAFPGGGGDGIHAFGNVHIELLGGHPFHGISISHLDGTRATRRHQFHVISRTSVGDPGYAPDIFRTDRYEVHTIEDHDPIRAASTAIEYHLEKLLPPHLGDPQRIPAALEDGDFYRMSYRDQVVDPIKTAVIGMCREPERHHRFDNGEQVWAIGAWKLRVLEPQALTTVLALGEQIQDVLVVPASQRGDIQHYLL